MKKSLCLVLVLILVLSLSGFAAAETTKDAEAIDNPYGNKTFNLDNIKQLGAFIREKERLSDEYYQAKINGKVELAAKLLQQLDYLDDSTSGAVAPKSNNEVLSMAKAQAAAAVASNTITMYWERQWNNYYCGPATARMIVWRKKSCPTQDGFAVMAYLGTDYYGETHWSRGNGSSLSHYPMATTLNQFYIGVSYVPRPYPAQGTILTEVNMRSTFVASTDRGDAIAFAGQSISGAASYMPGYPSGTIGHWLTADSYVSYGYSIEVVDPASGLPGFGGVPPKYTIASQKLYDFSKSRGIIF